MVTPAEAGLGFAVAYEKPGGFIGQAAAIAAKESKNIQRCVNFWLHDNPEVFLYGGETIVLDGVAVGYLSSASYAHSLGGAAGMGAFDGESYRAAACYLTIVSYCRHDQVCRWCGGCRCRLCA